MAEIQAFGALRFTHSAGEISELVCPPYDIISEEERAAYLARNPHNIIRLELPREGADPYRAAGDTLHTWLEQKILACDEVNSLYIYEEIFQVDGVEKSIKGLACRVRLEEFSAGVVLPHEETLSKAKEDRFNLMNATGCNFSSIYSLYFDKDETVYSRITRLSSGKPLLDFTGGDGIRHRVWQVTDGNEIAGLQAAFEDKKLYIADGHHRYETGLRYREQLRSRGIAADENHPANFIMMTLFHMEHPGLVVFPTHRIIRDLEKFNVSALLEGCGQYFSITDCTLDEAEALLEKAGSHKTLALYHGGRAKVLELRDAAVMAQLLPHQSEAYRQLDVTILHTLILERLLGIDKENMANQVNLTYSRDITEAVAAVDAGKANCAFILNPTRVSEIADVAGAGEKMPQKSTYFYPKLITGHLMNQILE